MEGEKVHERSDRKVEGETEDDEEKMEKFFALIRGFQAERNRRIEDLQRESETKNKKSKTMMRLNEAQSSLWVPSFEEEDFTGEIDFVRTPVIFPLPCNNNKDEKEKRKNKQVVDEDEDGLDLKLTL